MTELEHIEVEGFKGLEYVEFDPTDINLITGRNNTGKTSFLQSIDVAFNAEGIDRFEDNIDTIINVSSESTSIGIESSEDEINLALRDPTDKELFEALARVILHKLMNSTSFLYFVQNSYEEDEEDMASNIEDMMSASMFEELKNTDLSGLKGDFLMVSRNEEKYPYFSPGKRSSKIISKAYKEVEGELSSKIDQTIEDEQPEQTDLANFADSVENRIGILNSLLEQISDKPVEGFIEVPEEREDLTYIEPMELTKNIDNVNKEEDALKVDNIGDYIKDSNLVDNLKTFTLEYLVFEKENGGKYEIPYDFMGDGFKSIVGLLWELMDDDVENDIVLIEEPENHMHPGYVAELVHFLIDLARDEDIQLFITTHDHDFIKDFFMDMPDEKREYLEDEFSLVKMDDFGADVMEYEEAEHHLKDLHLDLRGI